jgi:cell wall-associated NlpC family hydrolase
VFELMGLLHRLRRRLIRPGRPLLPAPARRRVPLPTLFALVLGAGVFWCIAAAPAHAVPATATTSSTTTTVFTLKGGVKIQVDNLTARAQAVQAEIDALDEELLQKTEEYNKCLEDLDSANARMSELRRMVADAQADKARRQAMLDERIRSVYKSGGRDQLLQLLLLADGMEDLYNRVRLVATLADQDQRLVSDLKDSTTRLDLLLTALDDQKRQQLAVREQLTKRAFEIQTTLAERDKTLAGLDARVKAVIEQERQRQKEEQERLQRELEARLQAALLAAQIAAQNHVLNAGQVYHGTLPQTEDAILNQVIETAASYMGIPYVWGGTRPSSGMDCSGFVRYVFKQHGVNLPHYSGYQAQLGIPVELADIQAGDLVAFGYPVHHVGIYIGDGLFIHTPGDYVKIQKLSSRHNLSAIRRFPLELRTGPPLFG